jgi:beta-N-acetylhexosaminidase
LYPKITRASTPASLSKKWITGILREKIGYKGLVISDDLDMGGVLNSVSIEEAALATLKAGSDMFLVCQKEENVWRAFEAVYQRAERSPSFARMVALKAKRVAAFKEKSAEVRAKMAAAPNQNKVEKMRRRVWEFTEAVRLGSLAASAADVSVTGAVSVESAL